MSTKSSNTSRAKKDTGSEKSKPENWVVVMIGQGLQNNMPTVGQQAEIKKVVIIAGSKIKVWMRKTKKKCHIFVFIIDMLANDLQLHIVKNKNEKLKCPT